MGERVPAITEMSSQPVVLSRVPVVKTRQQDINRRSKPALSLTTLLFTLEIQSLGHLSLHCIPVAAVC